MCTFIEFPGCPHSLLQIFVQHNLFRSRTTSSLAQYNKRLKRGEPWNISLGCARPLLHARREFFSRVLGYKARGKYIHTFMDVWLYIKFNRESYGSTLCIWKYRPYDNRLRTEWKEEKSSGLRSGEYIYIYILWHGVYTIMDEMAWTGSPAALCWPNRRTGERSGRMHYNVELYCLEALEIHPLSTHSHRSNRLLGPTLCYDIIILAESSTHQSISILLCWMVSLQRVCLDDTHGGAPQSQTHHAPSRSASPFVFTRTYFFFILFIPRGKAHK